MLLKKSLCLLGAVVFFGACETTKNLSVGKSASIVKRGVFDCFEEGAKDPTKSTTYYCETSAVLYHDGKIYFASDKSTPKGSPAFFTDYGKNDMSLGSLTYIDAAVVANAQKFEDFTLVPGSNRIIATTGFDRVHPANNSMDVYNTICTWLAGKESGTKMIAESSREGIASSMEVRRRLAEALASEQNRDEMPYFKVEGLAAMPGNQLLFGIRELGNKYDDFSYSIKLVQASFSVENDNVILKNDFDVIYDYSTKPEIDSLHTPIALSSIEYDPFNKRLYLLTSFESEDSDEGIGAYLWYLSLDGIKDQKPPTLVRKKDGNPLLFAHKAEGLTPIDKKTVFVIHDDDRVLGRDEVTNPETQFKRGPHQAAYTIVKFK